MRNREEIPFPEVIDNSSLTAWKKCPSLYKMEYLEHWKLQGEKVDLHAGQAFAKGIEETRRGYWEKGLSPEDSLAAGLQALMVHYGDYQCPPESAKSLERMCGALEYYYSVAHPLASDEAVPIKLASGARGIEFSFAEPVDFYHPVTGNPIILAGRADAICDFNAGIYITDEKTTKYFGDTWANQWMNSAQFTGYLWAARRAGIEASGVLVRGIQILKTKYEHRDALTYRSDFEIDRWYEELLHHLEQIRQAWERYHNGSRVHFTSNLGDACSSYGGCAFQDVCKSSNPTPWLHAKFERRRWDPVTRTETLLPQARKVKFTLEFEATVPGEYSLETLKTCLEANPPETFSNYCEGPFEARVEAVAPEPGQVEAEMMADAHSSRLPLPGVGAESLLTQTVIIE